MRKILAFALLLLTASISSADTHMLPSPFSSLGFESKGKKMWPVKGRPEPSEKEPEKALSKEMSKLVNANTAFACDLYSGIRSKSGNLFFSPYSISSALAMCYLGARGNTSSEMARVLNFSLEQHVHKGFSELDLNMNSIVKKGFVKLSIANSLWAQKDYLFSAEYMDSARKFYNARIENLDFKNDTESSRKKINNWTAEKTNNLIQEILASGAVNQATRLVLVNAIYFKGDWKTKFKKSNTEPMPFWKSAARSESVPMMYQKASFQYGETPDTQVLVLPYKGDDLSMMILLPKARDGIKSLENKLSMELINKIQQPHTFLNHEKVKVYLPKFRLGFKTELARILSAMGMKSAFDSSRADFSGMDNSKDLSISEVLHKAVINVDEKGTEAAAATAVAMTLGCAAEPPENPKLFQADHPFIFFIRDNSTKSILFMGRLSHPE
jgi:serpin B